MNDDRLLLDIDNGIATLTLNRPTAGNSIDMPMAEALLSAAIRFDQDPAIRCVLLTGAGRLFCAGGDVGSFASVGDEAPAFLSELAGKLHMAVSRLMRMPKPLVVAVNGPAAGAGLSLAISGDVVIAGNSASFTAAYGAIGLTPDGGMSWLLPRLVGMRRAQEMILCNSKVDAARAAEIGLVSRTVADADLLAEARAEAERLANGATAAIGGARALLLASHDGSFEAQLERETRSITAAGSRGEFREGLSAFLQRRKPDFRSV